MNRIKVHRCLVALPEPSTTLIDDALFQRVNFTEISRQIRPYGSYKSETVLVIPAGAGGGSRREGTEGAHAGAEPAVGHLREQGIPKLALAQLHEAHQQEHAGAAEAPGPAVDLPGGGDVRVERDQEGRRDLHNLHDDLR